MPSSSYRCLEDVVGCKWSVSVISAVAEGVTRPGAIERHVRGISTKVLTERLRKLTAYGLLVKHSYPEVPPRTEYSLTARGKKLARIIEQLHALDREGA
ncbi:MAG: transcriptional regulator [Myxococcales bacterium]|nr:MAG: transcriptional regulator [Myxococcales bacterium]